ncbi:MAG: polyprenyl synthetase family protein [Chloroflexi bacterium]|nr:polyprenyl synthetase family protein [Chloroflexota bacterium]
MELASIFQRYEVELKEELKAAIGGSSPLYDMMRYHLGWMDHQGQPIQAASGKGLRPTFCLLACEAAGGHHSIALPAAAAVELIHNFSLIHDDIEDSSPERRYRPTVWWLWGIPQAINAGDGMHVLARRALWRLKDRRTNQAKMLAAARILDEACLKLCEGQYLDIAYEKRLDIGVADYLAMIERKTAALFASSFHLGALLGTQDHGLIERFRRCGHQLGLAFQMVDDILGIWGQDQLTGKSTSDIQTKKKSLPVVYGLETAKDSQKEELLQIYGRDILDEGDVRRVLAILESLEARGYVQSLAQRHYGAALAELEALKTSPALEELKLVAAFMVEREY